MQVSDATHSLKALTIEDKDKALQKSPFGKTPKTLILHIASYIDVKDRDFFVACRSFRAMDATYFEQNATACVSSLFQKFCKKVFPTPPKQIPEPLWQRILTVKDKVFALDLQLVVLTHEMLEKIKQFKNLQSFRLGGRSDAPLCDWLQHFPKLKKIEMNVHDTAVTTLEPLFNLKELEDVTLTTDVDKALLTPQQIAELTFLPKVTKLSCSFKFQGIETIFHHFIERKAQFEALSIGSLYKVSDKDLREFIDAQPKLASLILQSPVYLSEDTLFYLCETLSHLHTLQLYYVPVIDSDLRVCTVHGFENLHKLPKLEHFLFTTREDLKGEPSSTLCKALAKVNSLKTVHCTAILSSDDLQTLQTGAPLLENITCKVAVDFKFTFQLLSFIQSKPRLKTLRFYNLNDDQIRAISQLSKTVKITN